MRKSFFTAILLLTAFLHGQAQSANQYVLVFSARGGTLRPFSIAGHAFVSWGCQPQGDSILHAPTTLGMFPGKNASVVDLIFTGTRSEIVSGFERNSRRQRIYQMAFSIDSATWLSALDTAQTWKGRRYFFLHRNCVTFMKAVAEAAGLKTPPQRTLGIFPRRPRIYLKRLMAYNRAAMLPAFPPVYYDNGKSVIDVIVIK